LLTYPEAGGYYMLFVIRVRILVRHFCSYFFSFEHE